MGFAVARNSNPSIQDPEEGSMKECRGWASSAARRTQRIRTGIPSRTKSSYVHIYLRETRDQVLRMPFPSGR